jgi:hypothetical protein
MSIPTKYCISIMINGKSLWIFRYCKLKWHSVI